MLLYFLAYIYYHLLHAIYSIQYVNHLLIVYYNKMMAPNTYEYQLFYDPDLTTEITKKIPFKSHENSHIIGHKYSKDLIEDDSVEDTHCEILLLNKRLFVHNLSNYGIYYKIPSNQPTNVPYNNYFVIGRTWIKITHSMTQCKVDAIDHNYNLIKSALLDLNKEFTIGTFSQDDIYIPANIDNTVSKKHVKVIANDSNLYITDYKSGKGSTNGTWVNIVYAEIVTGQAALRIGLKTFLCVTLTSNTDVLSRQITPNNVRIGFEESSELTELIANETGNTQASSNLQESEKLPAIDTTADLQLPTTEKLFILNSEENKVQNVINSSHDTATIKEEIPLKIEESKRTVKVEVDINVINATTLRQIATHTEKMVAQIDSSYKLEINQNAQENHAEKMEDFKSFGNDPSPDDMNTKSLIPSEEIKETSHNSNVEMQEMTMNMGTSKSKADRDPQYDIKVQKTNPTTNASKAKNTTRKSTKSQFDTMQPVQFVMKNGFNKDEAQIAFLLAKEASDAIAILTISHNLSEKDLKSLKDLFQSGEYDETTIKIVFAATAKNIQQTREFLTSELYSKFKEHRKAHHE